MRGAERAQLARGPASRSQRGMGASPTRDPPIGDEGASVGGGDHRWRRERGAGATSSHTLHHLFVVARLVVETVLQHLWLDACGVVERCEKRRVVAVGTPHAHVDPGCPPP